MNPNSTVEQKRWKQVGRLVNSYEEARAIAEDTIKRLTTEDDIPGVEIKIKRCGPAGTRFKIKVWYPALAPKKKKKNEKAKKRNKTSASSGR